MTVPDESLLGSHFQTVLQRKFGGLLTWKKPQIERTVGPFDPTVFADFEASRDNLVSEAQRALRDFTDANIALLNDTDLPDPDGIRAAWQAVLKDEIQELSRRKPSWLQGGFGHPDYRADFDYWGKMESFSLHESLLLSIGVEPKHFGEKQLAAAKKAMEKESFIAPIEFLVGRHEQFFRKFPSTDYGKQRVGPSFLVNWFDEVSLDVHPGFMQVLRLRTEYRKSGNAMSSTTVKPKTDRREVDKIAQLFTALAIDSLGYDPQASRSPVPKEITDLAADMGMSISDDTVRKYLKLGARFIPDDWEPK